MFEEKVIKPRFIKLLKSGCIAATHKLSVRFQGYFMRVLLFLFLLVSNATFAEVDAVEIESILKDQFGVSPRPYSTQDFGRIKYDGAISVIIPEKDHKMSLLKLRGKLPKGVIAYIGTTRNLSDENTQGVELVVLISNDKFDILRASNSDGINHDITNEKLIKKLQSWNKKYNIDIWQAETDTVQLTIERLPKNLESFAQEVYEFCPDIVNQGSGNISDISDYLKSEKAIYLWWD